MNRKMKHNIFFIRTIAFCIATMIVLSINVFAKDEIKVCIGDEEVKFKQSTYRDKDGIWVDISSIVSKLGGKYFFNKSKSKFTIINDENSLSYFVGQNKVYFSNGKSGAIPFTPILKDGYVMMPLKYITENFGQSYKIDEANSSVYIFDVEYLILSAFAEKNFISDPFLFWIELFESGNEANPDIIKGRAYYNSYGGAISYPMGDFEYKINTGELYRINLEDERQLVGKYPINNQTASKYKKSWIKFPRGFEDYGSKWNFINHFIASTINSDWEAIKGMNKKSIQMTNLTPKQRGKIMQFVIGSYNTISSLALDYNTMGTVIDLNKTNEVSKQVLGGVVDMSDYLVKNKTQKNILSRFSAFPKEDFRLTYRKEEGKKLTLKGEILIRDYNVEQTAVIIGSYTATLEKNQKSPIGYTLKTVDYDYFKDGKLFIKK